MKKKILYVTESFAGGVFSYLVDLSSELADYFDIYVAYSRRPETPVNFETYFDPRIKFVLIKNFKREINLWDDFKAGLEIKKTVETIRPEIVHLNSSKAGVLGRVFINESQVKVFYTPHGYSFLMQDKSKLKRKFYWLIEKVASMNKSITIGCSKDEYRASKKINKRSLWVNNGVNIKKLDEIHQKKSKLSSKKMKIFTIGRICEQKNPILFNEIAKACPNYDFIWIGDGELKSKLTAPNIKITGWLDRNEALAVADNADVFTLTSLWEGLPMSLLEAMYLQKPCLVNGAVGDLGVIENFQTGFVCSSVKSFVSKLDLLDKDCKVREKIAYKSNFEIRNEYNTQVMATKYKKIYEKVME